MNNTPDSVKMNNTPDSVKLWINTVFRNAIGNEELLARCVRLMVIGVKKGESSSEAIRIAIASAVLEIADMDPGEWK